MKTVSFFVFIILIACTPHAEKQASSGITSAGKDVSAPFMYFKEDKFDAGTINQGVKVHHTFLLENKGKTDLILESVTASCGCTIAKWNKKPIAPGKSAEIEVIFNSDNKIGSQHKNITVKSNAVPDTKVLSLKCEVVIPKN